VLLLVRFFHLTVLFKIIYINYFRPRKSTTWTTGKYSTVTLVTYLSVRRRPLSGWQLPCTRTPTASLRSPPSTMPQRLPWLRPWPGPSSPRVALRPSLGSATSVPRAQGLAQLTPQVWPRKLTQKKRSTSVFILLKILWFIFCLNWRLILTEWLLVKQKHLCYICLSVWSPLIGTSEEIPN